MGKNLNDKKEALLKFADQLNNDLFKDELITAYVQDTGFLRKNVLKREITTPLYLIHRLIEDIEVNYDSFVNIKPKGKVAILLPSNGINMMIAKAVCASFLAGNETVIKLPRKLTNSNIIFRQLVLNSFFNVEFESNEKSSEDFLKECILNKSIKAIVIYGDDKWIWSYKNLVRRTETKLIFEGPGKDPMIVMPDADINLSVDDAIAGCLLNGGQSCSALERFFVHKSLVDVFCTNLVLKLSNLNVGDPNDDKTDIGPINSNFVIERVNTQVKQAISLGAKLLLGGRSAKITNSLSFAYLPTVIAECSSNMDLVKKENFAPVFPIISFETEEDLLFKIDDCNYGLNASAYGSVSHDFASYLLKTHRNVYFNSTVTSTCNQRFQIFDGGFKSSGFIWTWKNGVFLQIEGKRSLLQELSDND